MTAYGRAQKTQQRATPENIVAARKQARQAVLRRVRKRRAIITKRLAARMSKNYSINLSDSIQVKEQLEVLKKGSGKIEKSKRGDKPKNINYTGRLVEYGNRDYEASLVLFNIQDREYDLMNQAAFLCAQATEKYLKAFLFWKSSNTMPSEEILKKLKKFSHNLESLLDACIKENSGFQKFKAQVINLNNYSLLKYPDIEDKMVFSNTGFLVSSELSKDVNKIGGFVKSLVN